jgi:hypothetical protein
VCGSDVAISETQKIIVTYIVAIRTVAMANPPTPPASNPKFQLKYSPEMT